MRKGLPVFLVSILFLGSAFVEAQRTTATILGTAKDESGGVIPGVTVTITNTDTGASRTLVTDTDGSFRALNLMVGNYEVKAELAGFKTTTRRGIALVVGQEAVVDLTLTVGELSEQVMVTGEAPLVESHNSVLAGLVDQKAIRDLPLNGRSFIELATLQAGASFATYGEENESQGYGKKISISGSRFTSNLFLLDGTVMNDSFNSAGSSAGGVLTGVETVREFKVITNAYSSEYGQHTGGVVHAVTKSGTNELHGSVYEFHRNDNLDARNFFDPGPPPEFKRNQFGASAGGPIFKDRTFYFANYEGLRERLGITERLNVPSLDARRGFLPQVGFVGVDSRVQPFLEKIYPLPNGRDFGDGRAEFIRSISLPTEEDFLTARIDHTFSSSDSLFGRYTIDDAVRLTPESINVASHQVTRNQYVTLQYDHIFSPSLLNNAGFSFTRTKTGAIGRMFPGFERVTFTDSPVGVGALSIGGLESSGSGATDPRVFVQNTFQLKDDLTYTLGRHSLKFGGGATRIQHNIDSPRQPAGDFSFENLEDFLRNRPQEALMSFAENFHRYVRQTLVGLYLQDDYQVRQNLTMNIGVRWELLTSPKEIRGQNPIALEERFFDRSVTPKDIVLGESVFVENPSYDNIAPRVGLAWDPSGSGNTSIRLGAGIFHEQLMFWTYRMALLHTAPLFVEGRLRREFVDIDFPNAFFTQRSLITGSPRYEAIDATPNQPYVAKFSLEIQRSLGPSLVAKVGYSGTRGVHTPRMNEINGRRHVVLPDGRFFFPANERENNPNFGRGRFRGMDGISNYHSFRAEVSKRFSRGFQFQGTYTFSKNIDDGSSITGSTDFSNERGASRHFLIHDKGLSALDLRHAFALSFVCDLPGQHLTGSLAPLFGGWRLNGLTRLTSGQPFSAETGFDRQRSIQGTQYPDLATGASKNPTRPGNPDQYYDPTAFALQPLGFLGNLGRNTLIGPGVATFDFSLAKSLPLSRISEGTRVEFRGEFFNVFNRANFGLPVRSVFDRRSLRPRDDAGRITRSNTTSRQIQFGLKLIF